MVDGPVAQGRKSFQDLEPCNPLECAGFEVAVCNETGPGRPVTSVFEKSAIWTSLAEKAANADIVTTPVSSSLAIALITKAHDAATSLGRRRVDIRFSICFSL